MQTRWEIHKYPRLNISAFSQVLFHMFENVQGTRGIYTQTSTETKTLAA